MTQPPVRSLLVFTPVSRQCAASSRLSAVAISAPAN